MQLIRQMDAFPESGRPIVLAAGCFDGVHLGHQAVIRTAVDQAGAQNGEAWVFTFHPHPAKLLSPENAPVLINTEADQIKQFEALGVTGTLAVPFTSEFAQLMSDEFIDVLAFSIPKLAGIVCGEDWSFGHRAAGDVAKLTRLGTMRDIDVTAVPAVGHNGERISSTRIRQAVRTGDLSAAGELLGRPFSLSGRVVRGEGIGTTIGFPTANLEPENELLPAHGVYAAQTEIAGERRPSAVFIGLRETFKGTSIVVESHIFGEESDLYGKAITLHLIEKIRDVHPFPSRKALIEQIKKDVAHVRKLLNP